VIGQYYNFQGILHTANMMNTMTNMFMVFKMINIYWFVSNEMVRQHIDKYTNVFTADTPYKYHFRYKQNTWFSDIEVVVHYTSLQLIWQVEINMI
jgi:hypothetical protein